MVVLPVPQEKDDSARRIWRKTNYETAASRDIHPTSAYLKNQEEISEVQQAIFSE